MSAFLTILALPFALFGLRMLNDDGALSRDTSKMLPACLILLMGMVCWMIAMGSLRGIFAFLGLLTFIGMITSFSMKGKKAA